MTKNRELIEKKYKYYEAIKEGVFLTRDLVSEPPNILSPKVYAGEIKKSILSRMILSSLVESISSVEEEKWI